MRLKIFRIELEMTMLMWKNHFTSIILAENGTAHISSLCKWGPTKFIVRERVLPSGIPRRAESFNYPILHGNLNIKNFLKNKMQYNLNWQLKLNEILYNLSKN